MPVLERSHFRKIVYVFVGIIFCFFLLYIMSTTLIGETLRANMGRKCECDEPRSVDAGEGEYQSEAGKPESEKHRQTASFSGAEE